MFTEYANWLYQFTKDLTIITVCSFVSGYLIAFNVGSIMEGYEDIKKWMVK